MKKILSKISVLLLALVTLVSCGARTSRHNLSFQYDNLDELKTELNSAKLYDNASATGVYVFEPSENEEKRISPTEYDYKLYTAVSKEDKKTMTKGNVTLTHDHFVVESTLTFKTEGNSDKTVYRLSFRTAYDTDILSNAINNGIKVDAVKSSKLYKEYKNTYTLSVVTPKDGDFVNQPLVYVCSDADDYSVQQFTLRLKDNISYVKVGK